MLNTPHHLTPAELAHLRGIASRVADGQLADDAMPYVTVDYDASAERTVIPWRKALEIEE